MNITIRRSAALGDALSGTIVAQALKKQGHTITYQTLPVFHPVLRRCPHVDKVESPDGHCHINLDGCYEKHPLRKVMHIYDLMFATAQQQFPEIMWRPGYRPALSPVGREGFAALNRLSTHDAPWVMVCPRSEHYVMRQVPDAIWTETSKLLNGETLFWLGLHPAPANFVDLKVRNWEMLVAYLSNADLLVTVDTGPMHIAAAMDIPVVAISQAVDPNLRLPQGCGAHIVTIDHLPCTNCQLTLCPIDPVAPPCQKVDPQRIAEAVRIALTKGDCRV